MSIKGRLIGTFLLTFLLILTGVSIVVTKITQELITEEFKQHITTASHWRYKHIETYITNQKELTATMGASTVFRDFLKLQKNSPAYTTEKERTIKKLQRSIAEQPILLEMFIMDSAGTIVASSNAENLGLIKTADPYFTQANDKIFFKDIYHSETIGKTVFVISAPIKDDATNKLLGVVAIRFDPSQLYTILADQTGLGTTGETFLVNQEQLFISPSKYLGPSVILTEKLATQNVNDCFTEKNATTGAVKSYSDYRQVPILGTHQYFQDTKWCLVTKIDQSELAKQTRTIVKVVQTAAMGGSIILIIITIIAAQKITKPIKKLIRAAELIQQGNLDYKVDITSKDELGKLAQAFDYMTGHLKSVYKNLEDRIAEKTEQLNTTVNQLERKNTTLQNTQAAIQNILEDVQAEKVKAQESEAKQEALLSGIGDGVVACDVDKSVIYINQTAQELLEISAQEALGKSYLEILKVKNAINTNGLQEFSQAFNANKITKLDVQANFSFTRKGGTEFPAAITISPITLANKSYGTIIVFRDITKEKEVDRMKTEFISLASHQLRTPLSAVKWYIEVLLEGDVGELTEKQKALVKNMGLSNERMIELVNALLNVSRIESGRIIIDPQPTNLRTLLDEILTELAIKFTEKEIKPIVSVSETIPTINIDPKLIRQVFLNLLTNAIKYTPKNGEITIFMSKTNDTITTQITDTGLGIPDQEKHKVFSKFYRGENIIKAETEGNGLGLYLVKAIVESSGGKIWFDSKLNVGTTFWFTLPQKGSIKKEGVVSIDS